MKPIFVSFSYFFFLRGAMALQKISHMFLHLDLCICDKDANKGRIIATQNFYTLCRHCFRLNDAVKLVIRHSFGIYFSFAQTTRGAT